MRYFDEEKPSGGNLPCSGLREDLKACLLATDCVRKVSYFNYGDIDRSEW